MLLTSLVLALTLAYDAEACLQCDSGVRNMHEAFSLSKSPASKQKAFQDMIDSAYSQYRDASRKQKGVIDVTTLYRVKTEYQIAFKLFLEQNTDRSSEFISTLAKGQNILESHLTTFIRDGLCPNQCGLLRRRVMDCISCDYKIYSCPSPSGKEDCGEYPVEAEERGQAVLNCFRPWHSFVFGSREYRYTWAPAVKRGRKPRERDFRDLSVTKEAFVVLNQLRWSEQGTYRCSLMGHDGTLLYKVTFLLRVTRKARPKRRPNLTLPSLSEIPGGALMRLMAVVTALSLALSLVLATVIGKMIRQRKSQTQRSGVGGEKDYWWNRWCALFSN
ncbi:izumo sperm-egg fusion protein 1-like [Stigmatopora nigra]